MEALLAKQLDDYQEKYNLVHKGVHGFRKGRGTNTAMLEVWEYVLARTEKGELVALDFLDISAGFDTLVHLHLLRKMEVQFGMEDDSLEWLASYLEGWVQYVVVEASSSTPRKITKGAPQGGGLSPVLWRSGTNDIPEAGLDRNEKKLVEQRREGDVVQAVRMDTGVVSRLVDIKETSTTEEELDKKMRVEGVWNLSSWREERTGGDIGEDKLQQEKEGEKDVVTTLYADDTQSRAAAKTKAELEKINSRGITEVCRQLKSMRLKVNEDKTTYMILATKGRRQQENLESEIKVCGEKVKSKQVGKSLGLLVSSNMSWKDQVDKVVQSCKEKQRGLWKCTDLLKKEQRKTKAEGIILSRLGYCIEVVSSGNKKDLERMQSVQSAAARWVLQTRKKDWSLTGGLKKLRWLSMAQQAAFVSLKTAMRVLKDCKPERLYETLTIEKEGIRVRRSIDENKFKRLKETTRKSWSNRSLRWLDQMPEQLRSSDVSLKSTKEELKKWIKHHIAVRGDRILWGRLLTGDMRRIRRANGRGGGDTGGEAPADQGRKSPQVFRDRGGKARGARRRLGPRGGRGEVQDHKRGATSWSFWRRLQMGEVGQRRSGFKDMEKVGLGVTCSCVPDSLEGTKKRHYGKESRRRRKGMIKLQGKRRPRQGERQGSVGRPRTGEG